MPISLIGNWLKYFLKLVGAGGCVAVFRRGVSFEWSHEYKVTTLMLMRKAKMIKMIMIKMDMIVMWMVGLKDQIVNQESGFSGL